MDIKYSLIFMCTYIVYLRYLPCVPTYKMRDGTSARLNSELDGNDTELNVR